MGTTMTAIIGIVYLALAVVASFDARSQETTPPRTVVCVDKGAVKEFYLVEKNDAESIGAVFMFNRSCKRTRLIDYPRLRPLSPSDFGYRGLSSQLNVFETVTPKGVKVYIVTRDKLPHI